MGLRDSTNPFGIPERRLRCAVDVRHTGGTPPVVNLIALSSANAKHTVKVIDLGDTDLESRIAGKAQPGDTQSTPRSPPHGSV